MKHDLLPLITIRPDGFTEYKCLTCDRPVQQTPGGWRHYQRKAWRPRGKIF